MIVVSDVLLFAAKNVCSLLTVSRHETCCVVKMRTQLYRFFWILDTSTTTYVMKLKAWTTNPFNPFAEMGIDDCNGVGLTWPTMPLLACRSDSLFGDLTACRCADFVSCFYSATFSSLTCNCADCAAWIMFLPFSASRLNEQWIPHFLPTKRCRRFLELAQIYVHFNFFSNVCALCWVGSEMSLSNIIDRDFIKI